MDPIVDEVLTLETDGIAPLRRPVMVVALSGLFDTAGVATTALEEFAPIEDALIIGEIDPDTFYDFTQARPYIVITGGQRSIEWPTNRFEVVRRHGDRDLVIVVGTEPHLRWRTYSECIGTVAVRLHCEAVVTLGALPEKVPHTRPPKISASTTDPALAAALGISAPTYEGPTGVAGVMQAQLAERFIPTVSLRVGIPHYLMSANHPASVLALQTHLAHVLSVPMPATDPEEMASIDQARELHDQLLASDDQLSFYVEMLERDFDQRAEASIPSADDLGAQFEAFLDTQPDE